MDLDISQYINIFIEESKEHLQTMNDVLLELEKDSSHLGYINEIFRVAHTLKGMAGTMGFNNMANLTHEMENVLQATRSNELILSNEVIDILFECFDALELSIATVGEEGAESKDTNIELINKLRILLDNDKNMAELNEETIITDKIEIDTYVLDVIDKAIKRELNVFNIEFILSDSCMLKSARAFIIFNTLEEMGEIVYSKPSVEDIEDEKFERQFTVIIITEKSKEFVSKELSKISEVDYVMIDPFNDLNYQIYQNEIPSNEKRELKDNIKDIDVKANYQKPGKITKTVRVDIERLDNLMNLVSELIIIKTRMDDVSENSSATNISETIEYLERITTNLHDAVTKVRMVPIERVFNRFPRLVRDLSKELGKDIELEMTGEETEVDRTVIDEIGDPLIHLIRNSIDHGIELPENRVKIGKPEMGKVILKSYPDGNNVVIEVEDDGKGIDCSAIRKKAIEKGIIDERQIETMTDEESINLLFEAGFSTSDSVSDVSGRGVGLDVVKSKIESINGNIEVQTGENIGSRFIIRIPLTLAIIQALLIKVSSEIYAIPLSSITEIINISGDEIRDIQGQNVILYRGETLPIIRLSDIFGIEGEEDKNELTVVVVKKGDKQAGLMVDNLIGQQEIVIKGLGKYLSKVKYLSGATILGNGNISLIIDVNSLI